MTWQKMKVKNLSLAAGAAATNTSVGPYIDSYQVQTLSEGYAPYMFYVYHQLYDEKTGKPVEGAYVDLNGDGEINTEDLYRYHSPAPDYILGFSTSLRWKKWTLSTSLRANIGNYVYNAMAMNTGAWETVSYNSYQLNNLSTSYLKPECQCYGTKCILHHQIQRCRPGSTQRRRQLFLPASTYLLTQRRFQLLIT